MSVKSARGYTLVELVVVMAVVGATLYMVLPRLTDAFVADPLRDTVRFVSLASGELRAKAVGSQKRQVLYLDMDKNRMFTAEQVVPQPSGERLRLDTVSALGSDLSLAGVRFAQKDRVSAGTVPICFHRQGHADQAIVHLTRADGRRFSLYIDPFLSGIKVYPGHIDYEDLLEADQ